MTNGYIFSEEEDKYWEMRCITTKAIMNKPKFMNQKNGTECFGCEKYFVSNPKFKGYAGVNHAKQKQETS